MVSLNNEFELDHPSENVLEWCRNIVRVIADGGVWGIPRSHTIFRVDHKNKRLVLLAPGNDDGADFEATKRVFKHIGWDVTEDDHGATKS
ncbi:hypothetical protein EBZ80_18285 [bacterium]|nr:hypothetical protein [Betaproteobacteria bacterium]NDE16876.1 hypothetical protein [bacterium]